MRSLSKEHVAKAYMLTEPSSDPTMKKSFFAQVSSLVFRLLNSGTNCCSNGEVVFGTHVNVLRFTGGSSGIDSDDIVRPDGDQLFAIWSVCECCDARRVWEVLFSSIQPDCGDFVGVPLTSRPPAHSLLRCCCH